MKKFGTIFSERSQKEYSLWLELDEDGTALVEGMIPVYNCTCKFSSAPRFSRKNITNGVTCWHLREFIKKLKQEGFCQNLEIKGKRIIINE